MGRTIRRTHLRLGEVRICPDPICGGADPWAGGRFVVAALAFVGWIALVVVGGGFEL